jgi:hypothetical protein
MRGSQSHELETDIPASELWEVYGTLRASELLPELLPEVLAKVDVDSGDGGVGTILQLTFAPGEIDSETTLHQSASSQWVLSILFLAC